VTAQGYGASQRAAGFECPLKLRPRVNFWIDIFTKYGKREVVLHHRNYPQAVYSTLDLRIEADVLSDAKFASYKKKAIKTETAEIRMAIQNLAKGKSPRTRLEYRVRDALARVPGGSSKFKEALAKDAIRAQTGIKEKYAEAIKRSGRYMHLLVKTFVQDFGLPIELTRLPFIESSFDYKAYSSVGAAGIWQFMPRTAKGFGMKVGRVIDERRDVPAATRGAAKYLTVAYRELGDWPLALTSYNHGVAGVKRKVKKYGTSDIIELIENPGKRGFGFASGNFWPEFLAALDVYDNYRKYFPGLVVESPRYYTSYTIPHSMSVSYVSKKLGLPESTLQDYNYALSPSVWKGRYRIPQGYNLRIPRNVADRSIALRAPEPQAATSSIYGGVKYRVRRGDTLNKIARKFGVSSSRIQALNNMRGTTVYVGQLLTVKESEARSAPTKSAALATASGTYKVRSGDSLYAIAKRFKMSIADLMHVNGLRNANIQPGQLLKVSGSSGGVAPAQVSTYRVRSGDTISGIAKRHGMNSTSLMSLNGLSSSRIRVGQRLKVRSGGGSTSGPRYHRVGRGDTLWEVARKYGTTISAIKRANGLRKNSLYVGQKLKIP
jgi:membrane-bound lytic murein transglycosylase D